MKTLEKRDDLPQEGGVSRRRFLGEIGLALGGVALLGTEAMATPSKKEIEEMCKRTRRGLSETCDPSNKEARLAFVEKFIQMADFDLWRKFEPMDYPTPGEAMKAYVLIVDAHLTKLYPDGEVCTEYDDSGSRGEFTFNVSPKPGGRTFQGRLRFEFMHEAPRKGKKADLFGYVVAFGEACPSDEKVFIPKTESRIGRGGIKKFPDPKR